MKLGTILDDGTYIWHYFTDKKECQAASKTRVPIIETSPGTIWRCVIERKRAVIEAA